MGKRVAIILLVLLVSCLAILAYFFLQGRETLLTDPYKSISPRAFVVIETVDLQSFMNSITTGKGVFGTLTKIKELDRFNSKLNYLSEQVNKPWFKKLFNDGTALISFFPSVSGKPESLLSLTVQGKTKCKQVKEFLNSSGISNIIESKINGIPSLEIPFSDSGKSDTAFISIVSGLLLFSSSEMIIKEAGIQLAGDNDIRTLPGFSRVLHASGKNEDKIFIVFRNVRNVIKSLLGKDGEKLAEKISGLAGIAEGDIYINEDGLVLSGYTESTSPSEPLYKYKSLTPHTFQTYKILPSSTVLFETLVMPAEKTARLTGGSFSGGAVDLASRLRDYLKDEITRAYIDIKERPVSNNSLIIYELTNREQAEQIFVEICRGENGIIWFEPDDQIRIPVYKTPFNDLNKILLPEFSNTSDETYFTFYDNFLITGNSFVTISRILYDNMLNKTLANDLTYRDFEGSLPTRAGYFFYCVPGRISDYLSQFLSEDLINVLKSNKTILNKIQSAGFQLASSNEMIYNSLSVRFKEEVREESSTEWETLLDTVAGIKPFFFTNHITGAKEIFIQDIKNNIYLINAAGRVLWKVPLRERISGTVFMIDYYRNGKYQLLFSGKNYIHLIDRNGNYVERYPVKLRSPATNSLALFDYDNNLTYRLFIAGEDKMIYSYDITGNVVKGWNPFRTSGLVSAEINYFKVSGKDYIVVSDETSVYFLDRTGKRRVNLKEPVTRAAGSFMRLNPASDPSVICTSPDGTVQFIYFDGSVKKFSLRKFSGDHSSDIFDVDGDGFGEFIFIDKGILYLYDHNKSEMFARDFGSADLGGPICFIFSATDRKIGVFDNTKKLIFLIDKNGGTMNGFPLRGASMFSIGKLSDKSGWHLIVGGTDKFLYNYKIDTGIK